MEVLHAGQSWSLQRRAYRLHEVSARNPRPLIRGSQCVTNDVQAGREGCLVHERQQVDARAGEKDLTSQSAWSLCLVCAAYRDDGSFWHIICLFVELMRLAAGLRIAVTSDTGRRSIVDPVAGWCIMDERP